MPSGDQLANVTIATTDKWKDKQTGEMKEATEWHRVTFNGRLAEVVGQYLRKGSQVYVEGSLRTRKWTDQNGVEKYSTEIRADQMQMLGARQDGGGRGGDGGYNDGGYDQGGRQAGQQGGGNQGGGQQRQAPQVQQRQVPQQNQQRGPQQRQQGNQTGGYSDSHSVPPQRADSGFDSMDSDIPF